MPRQRKPRLNTCYRKRAFDTAEAAEKVRLELPNYSELHSYKCELADHWHIGHVRYKP